MTDNRYSLGSVLESWRNCSEMSQRSPNCEKYLSLALRLYVLPEIDPQAQGLKKAEFDDYCSSMTVDRLKDALEIFDRQFAVAVAQGKTAVSTGKNYRSALKQFMGWMEKQPWWQGLFPDAVVRVAPLRKKLSPMPKKKKGKLVRYSLDKEHLTQQLSEELENFRQFRLSGGQNIRRNVKERRKYRDNREARRPKLEQVKPSTFEKDELNILYFLGWYVREYGDRELQLSLLTDIGLIDDFVYWAIEERGVSHSTGVNLAKTAIAIAKWLNYDKSCRRNWSDIPLIQDLKSLRNEYAEEYQEEKKQHETQKWAYKELTHSEAREVVEYLRSFCAPRTSIENKKTGQRSFSHARPLSAVARAWQTYLIVKILVYCPVRQEEIRNWALGETLLRQEDSDGNPYYVIGLTEHKLSKTGAERHYRLPAILTKDLDLWLYKWRPLIARFLKTQEGWIKFWGYPQDVLERITKKIENAKNGVIDSRASRTAEDYIKNQQRLFKAKKRRIDAWEGAKKNFESHNYLFFMFGKHGTEAFGKPLDVSTFWQTVRRAIARATEALFGEAKWTNPHALRHIAEKHIRQLGKSHIVDSFGTLIGHSAKTGAEYAKQITSEYEITENIVDNWWLDDFEE